MALPDGWQSRSVDSLLSSCTYGVNAKLSTQEEGLPVLRMGNIQNHLLDLRSLKYADLSHEDPEKVRLRVGDVLFNRTNSHDLVGKVALVNTDRPLSYASYLLRLRTNSEADPAWLHYCLSSAATQDRLRAIATKGVSQSNINPTRMRALGVEVPPLPEQRKIAAILSSVDEAIEKTQAVIDQVQVVKRGLMQELLTRGLPGRHKKFKQTEIGEIPAEWEVVPASTACERIVVGIVIKPAQYYVAAGVPTLRSKNVREDRIDYTDLVYISQESNRTLRKSKLRAGDVVTVRTGYPGTSAVVPADLDGANCVDIIISTPGPRLRGTFFSRFVNSDVGKSAVAIASGGLAQQHFNVGAMKKMLVPLPAMEEQAQIERILASTDARLRSETKAAQGLMTLKKSLMSVILTGELRVQPEATE